MNKKIFFIQLLKFLGVTLWCSIYFSKAFSQNSDEIRWGSDANSGAPYVFRDAKNPSQVIGLDVDIIQAIAKYLNKKPTFVQNEWDGLIPGLLAKNYDVVIDGLEIGDDRKNTVNFSDPYYVTYEQLVVHESNQDIHALNDLNGKKVATLPACLAYKILKNLNNVEIKIYDEEVHAYDDLASNNRIDAVLLDQPIALYYAKNNPKLKFVGNPIGHIQYGIAFRKEDEKLKQQVNTAIQVLINDGTFKKIFEKWALWNKSTAEYFGQNPTSQSQPIGYENYLNSKETKRPFYERILLYTKLLPLLAKGAIVTLEISILSMLLAVVLGLLIALTRLYAPTVFRKLAVAYVELIRGTPLLIQLYLIFYGLPLVGIKLSPFFAAVLGLGLNYAANEAENYRAGIASIPHAQIDAAYALGMSRFYTLRYVIIPQALRLVIPPVTNDFIALIKDSSLVSVITLMELTTIYSQLASTYFDYLGIGLLTAGMYFLIGLPFARLSRLAENKFVKRRI